MIDSLKNNVIKEKKIIESLKKINQEMSFSNLNQRGFYLKTMESLFNQLNLINDSTPTLLSEISVGKKLDEAPSKKTNVVNLNYNTQNSNEKVSVKKDLEKQFVKETVFAEEGLKKISNITPDSIGLFYTRISSRIFGKFSEKLMPSLDDLKKDLRDSNSNFLLSSYVSMMLFSSVLTFLITLVGSLFFYPQLFFLWAPFVLAGVCFMLYYVFPSMQKSAISKKISNELPFATIYMAAISGSNIEPVKIFKLIASSKEYKYLSFEMTKVVNQIEVYGYDIVNALKNVSMSTPNEKFSELLVGMATNIKSGGSLRTYLENKADYFLLDYKMEREKYNSIAGTFMDIYISILVTAPLILVMMIIIMGATGIGFGIPTQTLVFFAVFLVILINIIFLIFLQIKQPKN